MLLSVQSSSLRSSALLVGAFLLASPWVGFAQVGTADLFEEAQHFEDQQDYAAAENVFKKILSTDPESLEALKRLGILEQTTLRFPDSIVHFKHVLSQSPEYPQVNFFLAVSYFGQRNYPDAIASFEKELRTSTPHPATHYYLALTLESAGHIHEAIDELNSLAEKDPGKADVFY